MFESPEILPSGIISSYDAPLLIVIGDVVKEQSLLDNTSRLSCFSKQVLFCSIDESTWPIDDLLLKKGIFTYTRQVAQPVYDHDENWDAAAYDSLVFSSRHAVKGFFQYLKEKNRYTLSYTKNVLYRPKNKRRIRN